ncbi:NAD(P)H-dependent oxidoreductase subunit E, partial [bacterium]|nr:NAD(P)H-dependent oxidoreductase subunit E [candidate division CSSED10-310 bacterium]
MKTTVNDLTAIAERMENTLKTYKAMVMVCTGTGCVSTGGFRIRDALQEMLVRKGLQNDYLVVGTGCNGFCAVGPIVVVQPEGVFYQKVQPGDLDEIVTGHLVQGRIVERLLYTDPVTGQKNRTMDDIRFFSKQQLIALRNKGIIDPENIDHAIARGAYQALRRALFDMTPSDIVRDVIASGIRGRGGGGFPTG